MNIVQRGGVNIASHTKNAPGYLTGIDRWTSRSISVHRRLRSCHIKQEVFKASFFENDVNIPCAHISVTAGD